MIQKIKSQLVILASLLLFAVPTLAPAVVSAQGCSTNTADQIAVGASKASSGNVDCSSSDNATTGIGNVAAHVVNIFSIIVGIVAVIMIIYGGFRSVKTAQQKTPSLEGVFICDPFSLENLNLFDSVLLDLAEADGQNTIL
jgi:hypothetical protein